MATSPIPSGGCYCIKWNTHPSTINESLVEFFQTQTLTDVTLSCQGQTIKCHKIVLSACSPLFATIYQQPEQTVTVIRDMEFSHLMGILDFIYKGTVIISEDEVEGFLNAARTLHVKGFADEEDPTETSLLTSTFPTQNSTTEVLDLSNHIAETTAATPTKKPRRKSRGPAVYKKYSKEDLQSALQTVREGTSVSAASRASNVPCRTLYLHAKKCGITRHPGRLTPSEEMDWSSTSASSLSEDDSSGGSPVRVSSPGFPFTKDEDAAGGMEMDEAARPKVNIG